MPLKAANAALRFLLELGALVALGVWGARVGEGPVAAAALGLGAPLLAAVVWGVFVAPRAPVRLPGVLRLLVELGVFGAAAAALAAAGRPVLAAAYGAAVALNIALMFTWGQR